MPILLSLLIAAAPPETVELRGVTILGHGPIPVPSGILHTVLRIDVRDAAGATYSLHRTYLGPKDVPETGAKCDVRYHIGGIGDGTLMDVTNPQQGKRLDRLTCPAAG
ncbi:hypothetical protein HZY97_16750 [Sphingomonas sp. R-74633]|uniref:hypothetical protein n=1 Tax=Sphingomonas sp. R-74633 TaxID=2751188 RepID=UPI0015D1660D|nr:hypothetical protein [Sphingomonas sp. R-74633]NYT42424.1 hypothetical protein [Sphingomonas sp. R-74633]